METIIIILLLIILAELIYVMSRLPRTGARRSGRPMFIDTSVLIDGRIMAIAQSGFITDTLMIPRSVIGELQFLADNADSEKRTRARHGLDVVAELQELEQVTVEIFQDGSRAEEGVDERLLKLAKQHSGALCTIDYNLNKVAQVEGIPVVNVNDLAKGLRMAYLPGEKITLALTTKGNDSSQAVGHLEDGTMVVVEQAKSKIGTVVEAEVIRSLQTAAGRMMFAKLIEPAQVERKKPAPTGRAPKQAAKSTSNEKSAATQKNSSKAGSDKVRGRSGRKPQQQPEEGKAQVSQKSRQQRTNKPSSSSRRKSNEDRLVELANSQAE